MREKDGRGTIVRAACDSLLKGEARRCSPFGVVLVVGRIGTPKVADWGWLDGRPVAVDYANLDDMP
jgi:hypothetical protein